MYRTLKAALVSGYTDWVIRLRLVSLSLIVMLVLVSTGVVCALPCGMEPPATAAPDTTQDTHCQKSLSSGPTAALAAAGVSCSDRDALAPAIGNSVRRSVDVDPGDIPFVLRDNYAVLIYSTGPIEASSPPGFSTTPISAPLRI